MGFLGFICNLGYGNLLGTAARVLCNQFLKIRMGLCCSKPRNDGDDSDHHVEFAGGNVHLITTKQSWDEKLSEASRDGKIEFSTTWDIKATPTFFFLRDGQQVEKLVGANKPELQKKGLKPGYCWESIFQKMVILKYSDS
ncbi:hypothetical protein HYC85_006388 [Camellia sinensis]|uniref:Thioredoxin domain-containing protein n=1 Tax=Camellia sinensis TaxID=4442 RepID=A0A7J7HKU7_CAMSI|nr:hypothetical protein HYC85_006388 [Camellia sinensis]